jgi:aspartyl-tRNA(Asn)/glutamyl-tRNA(Gln) amidotransferase subunit A
MQTLVEQAAALATGRQTSEALIESARLAADASTELNPLAWVDWNQAAESARQLDREAAGGRFRGPLHGIPISIKDLFNVDGMPTRAGTRAALPELSSREATLVTRLKAAGAVIFGKANMHEIALGATGENVWTGDVKNPFDAARQAGGSSSGSAVCVQRGIGLGSVGSDTGGSVRIPAAFCGVTGFKPTRDAIPLDGALFLSWTCDHAGPIAPTVADCALMYEVMAQRSVRHGAVPRKPRLALPERWLRGRLHPAVREVFDALVRSLRAEGVTVDPVEIQSMQAGWEAYSPLVRAEAAWVHRKVLDEGGEGFSSMVLPPLEAGRMIPARDYIDALKIRQTLIDELARLLSGYDALICPGNAVLPPLRGQNEVETESGLMSTRDAVLGQTAAFSLAGLPTLVLPTRMVKGLPTSLQIVGAADSDARVLALGQWFEERVRKAAGN